MRFLRVPFLRKIILFLLPPLPEFQFLEYRSFLKKICIGNGVINFDLLREAPEVVGILTTVYVFVRVLGRILDLRVLTNTVYIVLP